jgi:hypothetical protein
MLHLRSQRTFAAVQHASGCDLFAVAALAVQTPFMQSLSKFVSDKGEPAGRFFAAENGRLT